MNFLLADFGASRIKTAIVKNGAISKLGNFSVLPNRSKEIGHYEISLSALRKIFLSVCESYYEKNHFDGILICSQMHGFALLDAKNKPLTNYVSWKDERSLKNVGRISAFDLLQSKLNCNFKKITGMKPRPGFPFFNAVHFAIHNKLKKARIITLPDWLSFCSGDSNFLSHETMIAGLGFYDIKNRRVSQRLVSLAKEISGTNFIFNNSTDRVNVSGFWHYGSRKIPIYTGIGDHQCAVLGSGNIPYKTISVNIGTGSQVSMIKKITDKSAEPVEIRPYFNSYVLQTITHIPAGRIIEKHLDFLGSIMMNKIDYWYVLQKISVNEILKSTLKFDLAMFESAWNYSSGGKIENINENNFNWKSYLASLIRSFAEQYIKPLSLVDNERQARKCVLSGGLARNLPNLAYIFSKITDYKIASISGIDETLNGLSKLTEYVE